MYVPKNTVTKSKTFIATKQEENLLLDEMIEYTIKNLIKIYIWKEGELFEKQ